MIGPTAFAGRDAAILWATAHVLRGRPIDAATRSELGERGAERVRRAASFFKIIGEIMDGAEPQPVIPSIAGIETPADARATYASWIS